MYFQVKEELQVSEEVNGESGTASGEEENTSGAKEENTSGAKEEKDVNVNPKVPSNL